MFHISLVAATILWLSIPHFEETGNYQLDLPNPYNISFSVVTMLWIVICSIPISKFGHLSFCACVSASARNLLRFALGRAHVHCQNRSRRVLFALPRC